VEGGVPKGGKVEVRFDAPQYSQVEESGLLAIIVPLPERWIIIDPLYCVYNDYISHVLCD
jgi:hypothetical protein